MTTSRRLATLPLLLIGLAAIAALLLVPSHVRAQTPPNQDATGRPVVLASAEGAGILFADTEGIADGNGLPIVITKPKPRWDVHFQRGQWYGRTALRLRDKDTVGHPGSG